LKTLNAILKTLSKGFCFSVYSLLSVCLLICTFDELIHYKLYKTTAIEEISNNSNQSNIHSAVSGF